MNPAIKIKDLENAIEISQSPAVAYEKIETHFGGNPSLCDLSELFIKALKKVEMQDKADEKRLFPKQKLTKTYPTDILKTMPKAKLTDVIDLLCDENGNFKSCDAIKSALRTKDEKSDTLDDIISSIPTTNFLLSFLGIAGKLEGKNPYILMAEIIEPTNSISTNKAAQKIAVAKDNNVSPASTSSFARFASGCSVLAKAAVKDITKMLPPSETVRTLCTESFNAAATSTLILSSVAVINHNQEVLFPLAIMSAGFGTFYYNHKNSEKGVFTALSSGFTCAFNSLLVGVHLAENPEFAGLACGAAALYFASKKTKAIKSWAANAINAQKQITRN